jgi:hypothetical protein
LDGQIATVGDELGLGLALCQANNGAFVILDPSMMQARYLSSAEALGTQAHQHLGRGTHWAPDPMLSTQPVRS